MTFNEFKYSFALFDQSSMFEQTNVKSAFWLTFSIQGVYIRFKMQNPTLTFLKTVAITCEVVHRLSMASKIQI